MSRETLPAHLEAMPDQPLDPVAEHDRQIRGLYDLLKQNTVLLGDLIEHTGLSLDFARGMPPALRLVPTTADEAP